MNEYTLQLEPIDNQRLAELCGQFNEHLKQLESHLGVEIQNRGHTFQLIGQPDSIRRASEVLKGLYAETKEVPLTPNRVHLFLQQTEPSGVAIRTRLALVKPRSPRQERYIQSIQRLD
ncbi:MAG: phosphate starvation-inducible protein PhoH, partial [Gammaproteobacteria bacterium]